MSGEEIRAKGSVNIGQVNAWTNQRNLFIMISVVSLRFFKFKHFVAAV